MAVSHETATALVAWWSIESIPIDWCTKASRQYIEHNVEEHNRSIVMILQALLEDVYDE